MESTPSGQTIDLLLSKGLGGLVPGLDAQEPSLIFHCNNNNKEKKNQYTPKTKKLDQLQITKTKKGGGGRKEKQTIGKKAYKERFLHVLVGLSIATPLNFDIERGWCNITISKQTRIPTPLQPPPSTSNITKKKKT